MTETSMTAETLLVRRWLSLLLLAPALAMLQLLVFPRRPVAPVPPSPPPVAGGRWQLIEEKPGRRSRDVALSPSRTYVLQPQSGAQDAHTSLQLNLTGLAVRRSKDFQVAQLTASRAGLQVQDRRLMPLAGTGQIASGRIAGAPSWQTCLLPNGRPAVTRAVLLSQRQLNRPAPSSLTLWLGIQDRPGYQCLLVTISTDGSAAHKVNSSMQLLMIESFIDELMTKKEGLRKLNNA